MSVSDNNKKENTMHSIFLAMKLAKHTILICSNPNVFDPDKDFNGTILQKIVDTAIEVYMNCFEANGINVRKDNPMFEENMKERLKLQRRAIQKCNELYALAYLAQKQFHLPLKKLKYWCKLIQEVKRLIVNWSESDSKRLKP